MKLLATMSCLTVATALVAAETPELVWETGGFVGP
jgi:hypothetical protein